MPFEGAKFKILLVKLCVAASWNSIQWNSVTITLSFMVPHNSEHRI